MIRFRDDDGNDYPDWEEKLFSEYIVIEMGQSPPGDTYNIDENGIALINGPTEFTNKYPIKKQWTTKPTKLCQKEDILLCVRGSSTGRMNIADDVYCIGRGVAAIRGGQKVSTIFLQYQLLKIVNDILALTSGSTFPNIDSKSLKSIVVNFPSLEEQNKIGDFLTSTDDKLDYVDEQLKQTQQYKKAIMQQLFN